tara:strand:+ start:7 stop:207 length:201 start_codon:yes stop_codon:yes gene_type:complete
MPRTTSIETHSEEMSLLGEKLGLVKLQAKINEDIAKINIKLENIEKKKLFKILQGEQDELTSKENR